MLTFNKLSLSCDLLLAPMAGITDLPFRLITRQYGCALAFTEMVSSAGLTLQGSGNRSEEYLMSSPDDKPLGVQLFGSNYELLARAAQIAEVHGASAIDINMGCPVKKVTKTNAGAALLKDSHLVADIVQTVRKASSLTLFVKIRAGWDMQNINAVEIARIAEAHGADVITVHPRVATQGFSGTADWSIIKQVKDSVQIPVIGNGDVCNREDYQRMKSETGCDAVMIGRASLGRPWIFAEIIGGVSLSAAEKVKTIVQHLGLTCKHYGDKVGVKKFRTHLLAYTKGMRAGSAFRRNMGTVDDKQVIIAEIKTFWETL